MMSAKSCGRLPVSLTLDDLAKTFWGWVHNVTQRWSDVQSLEEKYIGFHVATEDSCYSIGLADKKAGTAPQIYV